MKLEDARWAKWSGDGNYYFATITDVSGSTVSVRYYDGAEEDLDESDVLNFPQMMNTRLPTYCNWQNKGDFYPCQLLQIGENGCKVKYEDNTEEIIPYQLLIFWAN